MRRRVTIPGQFGLAEMNATYRAKSAPESSLRRITHSTSFCATGSEMLRLTSPASVCLPLRTISTARLTAATSIAAAVMIVVAGGGSELAWASETEAAGGCDAGKFSSFGSDGCSVLLWAHRQLRNRLIVCGVTPPVRALFDLLRIHNVLVVVLSREEALMLAATQA